MDFFSILITEQSVIAVAEHRRRGCPVRQPSPKKSPSFRMPMVASFPLVRHNGESYLSFLYIKNSIGRVALRKDRLFFAKSCDLPTAVDGRKECLGIEFAEFLGRYYGCHDWPPQELRMRRDRFPDDGMNKCARRARTIWSRRQLRSARENNDFTLGVESQTDFMLRTSLVIATVSGRKRSRCSNGFPSAGAFGNSCVCKVIRGKSAGADAADDGDGKNDERRRQMPFLEVGKNLSCKHTPFLWSKLHRLRCISRKYRIAVQNVVRSGACHGHEPKTNRAILA